MKPIRAGRHLRRGNPFLKERVHDPYRSTVKLRSSTRCPDCHAQYRNGRWIWPKSDSPGLRSERCPACRRIADHYPAGELVLSGDFAHEHRSEILGTAHRIEQLEGGDHPLHRIMSVDEDESGLSILTTDIHLPHRIAHAVRDAWGGELRTHYDPEGYFTRVHWHRDD